MASFSHWCGQCRTTSPRVRTYGEALDAQAAHRDSDHGGRTPVGDRIDCHRTQGWADMDSIERWITAAIAVGVLLFLVYRT
ncbi:hypothetical protein ACFU6I_25845 [Streptomyces sp. NPDC057486]|uniref:hypothetical protein n=1 Tax=Streptomyces sp. NPDC057486 TaxID=3346145 RepID=UPI00368E4F62